PTMVTRSARSTVLLLVALIIASSMTHAAPVPQPDNPNADLQGTAQGATGGMKPALGNTVEGATGGMKPDLGNTVKGVTNTLDNTV
ncbi:hypothetical protein BGZ96_004822, partial [Linnemannia gamsii]